MSSNFGIYLVLLPNLVKKFVQFCSNILDQFQVIIDRYLQVVVLNDSTE